MSNHEEADTKICLHAEFIDKSNEEISDIAIRGSDTDIAVILIHHCHRFDANIWMDSGTAAKNNRRYIDISGISKALGQQLCTALPSFHAYSGCDYTSAFVRKGKLRPFKKLEKMLDVQRVFAEMAQSSGDEAWHREVLFRFTAVLYGAKDNSKTSLNAQRFKTFEKAYRPKANSKNLLDKLKGLDASSIPPCESEIAMHIKRVAFVSRLWANANKTTISQHPTPEDGWEVQDGSYHPIWFEGQQLPEALIPKEGELANDSDDDNLQVASSDEDEDPSDDEAN